MDTLLKKTGIVLLAVLMCAGCATVRTADNAHVGSPKVYGGTRLNIATLVDDEVALKQYRGFGIKPPAYPGIDFVPSLVGDTVLFPFALWYTVTEPIAGRK